MEEFQGLDELEAAVTGRYPGALGPVEFKRAGLIQINDERARHRLRLTWIYLEFTGGSMNDSLSSEAF